MPGKLVQHTSGCVFREDGSVGRGTAWESPARNVSSNNPQAAGPAGTKKWTGKVACVGEGPRVFAVALTDI